MFSQPASWRNLGRDSTPKLSTRAAPFHGKEKLPRCDDRLQRPATTISVACVLRARDRVHANEIVRLVCARSFALSLGEGGRGRRQPFSKGQKFIPSQRYASQRLFPGAVPLYVNAKTRSSFLVYFVSMPWQCDITLRNRFPAGHFLRRHVDAKPFSRDYCVADFNASTCILRFAFENDVRKYTFEVKSGATKYEIGRYILSYISRILHL